MQAANTSEDFLSEIDELRSRYDASVESFAHLDDRTVKAKNDLVKAHEKLAEHFLKQELFLQAVEHYYHAYDLSSLTYSFKKLYGTKKEHSRSVSTSGGKALDSLGQTDNNEVMFLKGLCYLSGIGVPLNNERAFGLFDRAAKQGHAAAEFNLALMYYLGRVEDNSISNPANKAFELFEKAADQGDAKAQYYCGLLYVEGTVNGVSNQEAISKAVEYYILSANQGHSVAQSNLGSIYEKRKLKDLSEYKSDREAVRWYDLAAKQGCLLSQNNLAHLYFLQRVNNVPMDEAYKRSEILYKQSANQGYVVAQFSLGLLYQCHSDDLGVSKEEADKQSVFWFRKAAQQGYESALLRLKHMVTSSLVPQGQQKVFAEYALFYLSHQKDDQREALKWFNGNPKQHLITYCHEFIDQLLSSDKTITDHVIDKRVQFIKQQYTRLSKFFGIFARPYPNDQDKELDYAVQRVFLYLDIFQRQKSSESVLERFLRLKKSEYFSSEDTFHLAMYYFRMACQPSLEEDQSSAFCDLGMNTMSCAADKGDVQAKLFLGAIDDDTINPTTLAI